MGDLVIGIDASTTAVKAIAFSRDGETMAQSRAAYLSAALEAISFEQALASDAVEAAAGVRAHTLIASGGGANSKLLMSIFDAVMQRPVALSPVTEAAALGAAMLAAAGAGWHKDANAASAAMAPKAGQIIEPDSALAAAYAPLNGLYRTYYRTIQPLQAELAKARP